MSRYERRAQILFDYGASVTTTNALLAYSTPLEAEVIRAAAKAKLTPELHLPVWQHYAEEAQQSSVFAVLAAHFPQLRFPIREGMSQSDPYIAATQHGKPTEGGGLHLEHPDALRLHFHHTVAGTIPVLIPQGRHDFVALVQALSAKNEPKPILASMGACILFGYVNWDRIHTLRRDWETLNRYPPLFAEAYWKQEWRTHIAPYKSLYQETFIIVGDGEYSGISANDIGRPADLWQAESLQIRLEHEVFHYVMRRLLTVRPSPIIEEMLADLHGMVAVWGRFDAERFLRFMGMEEFPHYREGGRLELYRGTLSLTDGSFAVLRTLIHDAAYHLEALYDANRPHWATPNGQLELALAISSLAIEELASNDYQETVAQAVEWVRGAAVQTLSVPPSPFVSAQL